MTTGEAIFCDKEKQRVFTCCYQECHTIVLLRTALQHYSIFVHTIPFYGDSQPEAVKQRKKWIDFARLSKQIGSPLSILQCILNTPSQMTTSISSPFCQKWATNPHCSESMEHSETKFSDHIFMSANLCDGSGSYNTDLSRKARKFPTHAAVLHYLLEGQINGSPVDVTRRFGPRPPNARLWTSAVWL